MVDSSRAVVDSELKQPQGKQLIIEYGGKYYTIPTVVDGKQLSDDDAASLAVTGKLSPSGRFKSYEEARDSYPMRGVSTTSEAQPQPQQQQQQQQQEGVDVEQAFQPPQKQKGEYSSRELYSRPAMSTQVLPKQQETKTEYNSASLYSGNATPSITQDQLAPTEAGKVRYNGKVSTVDEVMNEMQPEAIEKVSTSKDPIENALFPFRDYLKAVGKIQDRNKEMIGYDPEGPLKGALSSAMGVLGSVTAPIEGLFKTFAGDPIRRTMGEEPGSVGEITAETIEGLGMLAIPGMGIKTVNQKFAEKVLALGTTLGSSRSKLLQSIGQGLTNMTPGATSPEMLKQMVKGAELLQMAAETGAPVPPRMAAKVVDSVLPQEQKIGGLWGNFWEIIEFPFKKKFIPTKTYGKMSIQEAIQPAVDRLYGVGLDKPFRLGVAKKQLVMKAGQELGADLAELNATERLDVIRGLQGGVTSTQKGKDVVRRYKDQLRDYDLGAEYHQHFNKYVKDSIAKIGVPEINDPKIRPLLDKFFDQLEGSFKGKVKPGEIHDTIQDLLSNPDIDLNYRKKLVPLLNLPASTPIAVAEAADKATHAFMISGLKRSGAISAEAREGWELVNAKNLPKFPKLKDQYVPRDVFLELKAWQDVSKFSHGMMSKWFMTPWKTSKTVLSPATHVRNVLGNWMLNNLGGMPLGAREYHQALSEMRNSGKLFKEYRNLTGEGGTYSKNDLIRLADGVVKKNAKGEFEAANFGDRLLSLFDQKTAGMRGLYNAEEQMFKLAKYIRNRGEGMEKYDAAVDAMKWTFNYGEVTPFTAAVRSNAIPFFTWQSKIMPLMADVAKNHPMRLAKWFAAYQGMQMLGLNRMGMGDEEYQYLQNILPDYIADGQFLMMPFRDSRDRLQLLNLTYLIPGFGDINQYMQSPMAAIVSNPLISIAGGLTNNKTFTGAPIHYDWEAPSTKAAKKFGYVWEQIMPSWVPGGTANIWSNVQKMWNDHPDAPTWYQFMGGNFGVKINAIRPEELARKRHALTNIRMSELQVDLMKKMKDANQSGKSSEDLQDLVEKYTLLRQKLATPKESVGPTAQLLKLMK